MVEAGFGSARKIGDNLSKIAFGTMEQATELGNNLVDTALSPLYQQDQPSGNSENYSFDMNSNHNAIRQMPAGGLGAVRNAAKNAAVIGNNFLNTVSSPINDRLNFGSGQTTNQFKFYNGPNNNGQNYIKVDRQKVKTVRNAARNAPAHVNNFVETAFQPPTIQGGISFGADQNLRFGFQNGPDYYGQQGKDFHNVNQNGLPFNFNHKKSPLQHILRETVSPLHRLADGRGVARGMVNDGHNNARDVVALGNNFVKTAFPAPTIQSGKSFAADSRFGFRNGPNNYGQQGEDYHNVNVNQNGLPLTFAHIVNPLHHSLHESVFDSDNHFANAHGKACRRFHETANGMAHINQNIVQNGATLGKYLLNTGPPQLAIKGGINFGLDRNPDSFDVLYGPNDQGQTGNQNGFSMHHLSTTPHATMPQHPRKSSNGIGQSGSHAVPALAVHGQIQRNHPRYTGNLNGYRYPVPASTHLAGHASTAHATQTNKDLFYHAGNDTGPSHIPSPPSNVVPADNFAMHIAIQKKQMSQSRDAIDSSQKPLPADNLAMHTLIQEHSIQSHMPSPASNVVPADNLAMHALLQERSVQSHMSSPASNVVPADDLVMQVAIQKEHMSNSQNIDPSHIPSSASIGAINPSQIALPASYEEKVQAYAIHAAIQSPKEKIDHNHAHALHAHTSKQQQLSLKPTVIDHSGDFEYASHLFDHVGNHAGPSKNPSPASHGVPADDQPSHAAIQEHISLSQGTIDAPHLPSPASNVALANNLVMQVATQKEQMSKLQGIDPSHIPSSASNGAIDPSQIALPASCEENVHAHAMHAPIQAPKGKINHAHASKQQQLRLKHTVNHHSGDFEYVPDLFDHVGNDAGPSQNPSPASMGVPADNLAMQALKQEHISQSHGAIDPSQIALPASYEEKDHAHALQSA